MLLEITTADGVRQRDVRGGRGQQAQQIRAGTTSLKELERVAVRRGDVMRALQAPCSR